MSKIRAYYSTLLNARALLDSEQFQAYVSNDPNFWMSTYRSAEHILILINGDDSDHTVMSNQAGVHTADFDDIRAGIDTQTPPAIITKAVNNVPGLTLSDFVGVSTVRDVLTVIIKHLDPVQKSLSFDNAPRPSGTFTDDFTGTNGDLLGDRTGWTLSDVGAYDAQIYNNTLALAGNAGGSGMSAWICTDQGSANQYVQATDNRFLTGQPDAYLAVRLVDADNFIAYHLAATGSAGARLCKKVSGTLTDSIIGTQGAAGYGWKVECDGTTVRLFRDTGGGFSQIGTDQTINDHQTETSAGFVSGEYMGTTNEKWDDFENGTVGSGGLSINVTGSLPQMAGALTQKKSYHRALGGSI